MKEGWSNATRYIHRDELEAPKGSALEIANRPVDTPHPARGRRIGEALRPGPEQVRLPLDQLLAGPTVAVGKGDEFPTALVATAEEEWASSAC